MRPGTWQLLRTDKGWHARLVAPNGEPIVWSETYKKKRDAVIAVDLVQESFAAVTGQTMSDTGLFHEVDMRMGSKDVPPAYSAKCRDCGWLTAYNDHEGRANGVARHRLTTGHRVVMSQEAT